VIPLSGRRSFFRRREPRPKKETSIDTKLGRGEKVSVREIFEEYVEFEPSPLGVPVQTPESVKRAIDKVAEATQRGLLADPE